jgi:peroxiredoxin
MGIPNQAQVSLIKRPDPKPLKHVTQFEGLVGWRAYEGEKMFNRRRFVLTTVVSMILTVALSAFGLQPAEFTLRSIDGQSVSSSNLHGKTIVLIANASWLPVSRTQVQGVQKLADKYKDRNVEVFWVSTDSDSPKSKNYASNDQLREFGRKHNLKITILRDPDGVTLKRLGVDQVPAFLILDKSGNLSGSPTCGVNPDTDISERIAAVLDTMK